MDLMFIIGLVALIITTITIALFLHARPVKDKDGLRRVTLDEEPFLDGLKMISWLVGSVAVVLLTLSSFSIIQTGQAGVVRIMGVVQQESLGEGFNIITPWTTVTRQETRGFQIDQSGDNAMEVLTANGTRFNIELGIPVKLNPASVAMVESRIENGDWKSEVTSLARGLVRTNVSSYRTFGDFQTRRAAVAGVPAIITPATEETSAATRTWDVAYGEELAAQIETRVNGLFCNTYGICDVEVVDLGEIIIRKVNPPAAITSEAAALEAAQLSRQTESALNEVEEIRAQRREQEGVGYGNLFAFLPEGANLSASDAAHFLRAAADKTRADAEAYMQRQISESIADAMSKGQPLPSLIVSTGGNTPTPVFDPRGSQ